MARGETRFGSLRGKVQLVGTSNPFPQRGGEIGITRRTIDATVPGTAAATAANYGIVHTVPAININRLNGATPGPVWQVSDVRVRWEAAGTDGGGCSVMVMRVPSGTAKAAGQACLAAGVSLQGVINTNVDAALNATLANIQLFDGDSLALVTTGVLTAVSGVSVTIELMRLKG